MASTDSMLTSAINRVANIFKQIYKLKNLNAWHIEQQIENLISDGGGPLISKSHSLGEDWEGPERLSAMLSGPAG